MRQKFITKIILASVAIIGACLVLLASSTYGRAEACAEEESMENCAQKPERRGGGVIWENISHQFFSSF